MILIIISGKRTYELFYEIARAVDSFPVVLDVDAIPASFKGSRVLTIIKAIKMVCNLHLNIFGWLLN